MKEMRDVILAQRAAGKTLFFNSHSLAEVERICDRVAIMHKGRMVLVDSVAELVRSHQSSVTLGFSGGEELGGQVQALGFNAKRENKVWTLVVPNHALATAIESFAGPPGRPALGAELWVAPGDRLLGCRGKGGRPCVRSGSSP